MKIEFHLAIFAIACHVAHSVPYGLVRRLGAGFESIVVYAVPTSSGASSDQSYSSSSSSQNYYSPSSSPIYSSPSSNPTYPSYSPPSSGPSYSSPSSSQNYYSPSSSPTYSSPSSDQSYSSPSSGSSYSNPSSDQSYSNPSSDPSDSSYNTAIFCRHTSHSTAQRNYRQREQTYQPVVRETFRSRNNYYPSYGNEKTAHRTPNYSVRDSFESSHRHQSNYGRDNARVGQYGQTGSSYEAFTIHQKFPTSRTVMGYRLLPSSMRRA